VTDHVTDHKIDHPQTPDHITDHTDMKIRVADHLGQTDKEKDHLEMTDYVADHLGQTDKGKDHREITDHAADHRETTDHDRDPGTGQETDLSVAETEATVGIEGNSELRENITRRLKELDSTAIIGWILHSRNVTSVTNGDTTPGIAICTKIFHNTLAKYVEKHSIT